MAKKWHYITITWYFDAFQSACTDAFWISCSFQMVFKSSPMKHELQQSKQEVTNTWYYPWSINGRNGQARWFCAQALLVTTATYSLSRSYESRRSLKIVHQFWLEGWHLRVKDGMYLDPRGLRIQSQLSLVRIELKPTLLQSDSYNFQTMEKYLDGITGGSDAGVYTRTSMFIIDISTHANGWAHPGALWRC